MSSLPPDMYVLNKIEKLVTTKLCYYKFNHFPAKNFIFKKRLHSSYLH